jgi:hypothetical protein
LMWSLPAARRTEAVPRPFDHVSLPAETHASGTRRF